MTTGGGFNSCLCEGTFSWVDDTALLSPRENEHNYALPSCEMVFWHILKGKQEKLVVMGRLRLWSASQGREHKSYWYSCEKWLWPAVSVIAVQDAGQFNDTILLQWCPPRTCSPSPKTCHSRTLHIGVSEAYFVLGLCPGSWRLLFWNIWERIFKGISHQKSKGMKNLTLLAAQPLSPGCSVFPFRMAKPYLSCLVTDPVCSPHGFSWKNQSQWSPAMSKPILNCGTARMCSQVDVIETRSALRYVTAVVSIKWSSSSFAKVS